MLMLLFKFPKGSLLTRASLVGILSVSNC